MTRYVLGFMFSPDMENVLLIKKLKPAWQSGKLNGIGGKVEKADRSDEEAMSREFYEECGITTESGDWQNFLVLKGRSWECLVYRGISEKIFSFTKMEDEEPMVMRVENILNSNVLPNLKWIIPMALDTEFELSTTEYIK